MNPKKQYLKIARLIASEWNKSIDEEDRKYLEHWINESAKNREIYNEIKKDNWYVSNLNAIQKYNIKEGWHEINPRIQSVSKTRKLWPRIYKYAAVAILFLGIGYLYQNDYFTSTSTPILTIPNETITLHLENGKTQILKENEATHVVDAHGNVLGTQNGSQLVYTGKALKETLVYNTLTVPYGKRFKVKLSDGTVVNLNAGTSLKYPVKFIEGESRKVFLNGEAFFNVVKDSEQPFIVNANEIDIRVLGTQFNVSSYPEDEDISTVLVEGAVSMYHKEIVYNPNTATLLEPGYEGAWNREKDTIKVQEADIEMHTAWIGGKIVFRRIPFKNIIKKLERHYNVVIINKDKELDKKLLTASFDIENIQQVLETLNSSYDIKYIIKDNQIRIN